MDEDFVNSLFSIFEALPSDFEEQYGDMFDTEMEPSLKNAIRLNMAYQSVLMIYGQQLEARHINNLNEQKDMLDMLPLPRSGTYRKRLYQSPL